MKLLAGNKNSQDKIQKNANTKIRDLSWFGHCDLRPVPKQSARDFPFLIWIHPKPIPCTPLDKTPFVKCVQLLLHQEDKHLVQLLFYTKKTPLYNAPL